MPAKPRPLRPICCAISRKDRAADHRVAALPSKRNKRKKSVGSRKICRACAKPASRPRLKRRLRQIDAVIVANLGSAQRAFHHAGVTAGDVEEAGPGCQYLLERVMQDAADLTVGEIIAHDELAEVAHCSWK
jgi:hypothetical protein